MSPETGLARTFTPFEDQRLDRELNMITSTQKPSSLLWRGAFACACALALATLGITAHAAENEIDQAIEEITVTAHRIPIPAVPTVEVISQEAIEQRGRSVGPDVLATLPGLAISRNGAFGSQAQIRVRGSEANHLQVLVDGIEVNDPAIGSEYNFGNLNLTGINRIEYAPGAQSSLWGSDAVAGVLNLVSTPSRQRREIAITGGSFDTWQAQTTFADVTDNGYYSLSGSFYDTDGTNNALTGNEDDGFTSSNVHFTHGINGERYSTQFVIRFGDSEFDTDPAPFPISVPIDGDRRTDHKELAAKFEISANRPGKIWRPSLAITFLDTENDNRENGDVVDTVNGQRVKISFKNYWQLSDQQLWTAILEREEEKFDQTGAISFFGDPNQSQDGTTDSLSIEHVGNWGSLQTAISGRFDSNDDFEDTFSYRIAARYQIQDNLQAFAAYGTGIKNPSFYERFGFTPGNFSGNADLDPEENQHASIGLEFQTRVHHLQLTLFKDVLKDEINGFVFTSTPGVFTASNLTEDSDRQGAELLGSTQLAGFDLSAGYTYLDAEDTNGQIELRRPEHSGHLQIGHRFAGERGYLQIGSIFTGEQEDTDFRTFTPVTLDNYNRVHLNASYAVTNNVNLKARVENALDDETEDVFMFRPPKRAVYFTVQANL